MKRTELMPSQKEGVRGIYRFRGRALLADEQGLGKTLQALEWLRRIPKHRPAVIVAPASVKWTWQAEASLHFGMRVEVLEGSLPLRRLPGDIVVINYDILHHWLPLLKRSRPQCVILDEVHYCTNAQALRTKAVSKLVRGVPSVVGLSGTPMTNRPIELWSVMALIRPDLFPSRTKFAWRYCNPRYTPWGWNFDGSANKGELHRILRDECMIRRLKKHVLPELPRKQRRYVVFQLPRGTEYEQAQRDFLGWLRNISPERARKAKRSEAICKIGYLLRLAVKLKLKWIVGWVEDFLKTNPNKKLVLMTRNRFVIDHLQENFPRMLYIDGRVTGRLRTEIVRKFQTNPSIPILAGNWKAAGVGITLHAAHNIVAVDFPWTPGELMQGEDRVHRIGQKHAVMVHYLVLKDTIEERLASILQRKAQVMDAVLNGESSPRSAAKLDVFGQLLQELSQSAKTQKDRR